MTDDTVEEKASTTLPGTVEKIIKPLHPNGSEQAQIAIDGAEHLYKEIRIDNALTTPEGDTVRLKEGATVEVTVEADPKDVQPAPQATAQR